MYRRLVAAGWLLALLCLGATPVGDPRPEPNPSRLSLASSFPFLRQELNELQLFGDRKAMSHFFSRLRQLELKRDGQVRVLHLGDSHIQADFFSGKVRELFNQDLRFPASARGLSFPYKTARTNNPEDYAVSHTGVWLPQNSTKPKNSSQWGVQGLTLLTQSSSATITFDPNVPQDSVQRAQVGITRVKVFHPEGEEQFIPRLQGDSLPEVQVMRHAGMTEFLLAQPVGQVTLGFEAAQPGQRQFLLQGVSLENDAPGIIYHATGVNSASLRSYARCRDFDKHVHLLNPDLIVVSLGTNDAIGPSFDQQGFTSMLRDLLVRLRQQCPDASILLTTPGDCYRYGKYLNRNNETARQLIGQVAREQGAAVWDFFSVMGGLSSVNTWLANGLASRDRIHLSRLGYAVQGELLFEALEKGYGAHVEGK